MNIFHNKHNHGFTLIEVLIALLILAISLVAIIGATGKNIVATNRLTQKSIAHIVAYQAINMIQLKLISLNNSSNSIFQVTEFLGHNYYWQAKLLKTGDSEVAKLQIKVRETQENNSAILEDLYAFIPMESP